MSVTGSGDNKKLGIGTPTTKHANQQTQNKTKAMVSTSKDKNVLISEKLLSKRKILAENHKEIANIKDLQGFRAFIQNIVNKLSINRLANVEPKPAVTENKTEMKYLCEKKVTGLASYVAVSTIIVIFFALGFVSIMGIMTMGVAIGIIGILFIALAFYGGTIIAGDNLKWGIPLDQVQKDADFDIANIDMLASNIINIFFENKEIQNTLKSYDDKQFQKLANTILELLSGDQIQNKMEKILTDINFNIRMYLNPASTENNENLIQAYRNAIIILPEKIFEEMFNLIKDNIDANIANKIEKQKLAIFDKLTSQLTYVLCDNFENFKLDSAIVNDKKNEKKVQDFNAKLETLKQDINYNTIASIQNYRKILLKAQNNLQQK